MEMIGKYPGCSQMSCYLFIHNELFVFNFLNTSIFGPRQVPSFVTCNESLYITKLGPWLGANIEVCKNERSFITFVQSQTSAELFSGSVHNSRLFLDSNVPRFCSCPLVHLFT